MAVLTVFCLLLRVPAAAQRGTQRQDLTGPYRVAGIVVSKIDGHPLGQSRVTLADASNPQKFQAAITEDDGKFVFPSVPAGKFSLIGAKRGFIPAGYDQHDQFSTAIVTGAGLQTENLALKLTPNGMIHGKILDEAGDPVRRAAVTLYYDDHSQGVDQIQQAQGTITDDLGAYELISLRPGAYYLSANANPWYAVHPPSDSDHPAGGQTSASAANRTLDVAYPLTYYPDVTDTDSASPIPIKGGDRVEVDIHLNPVPALRLLFHVPGDARSGYSFPQLFQQALDGSTYVNGTNGTMVSPGIVEVAGIPSGRYDLQINGQGAGFLMSGLDLTTQGQEVDTSTAEAFSTVKITVQIPDLGKPGELFCGLLSPGRTRTRMSRLDAKGEAELPQVAPGDYEVALFGRGRRYSVSRVSAEGAEVSGNHVTIASGAIPSISATAVAGSIVVEGAAKRAGRPAAGVMVVLVPKDVEGNRDLFRRDQSDLDGTFSLRDVTPGSYTLVAIENGWDLDWSQPGAIAVYAKHGRAIEISNTPGKPVHLSQAIEVVSK